jgi:hypothetical protein
VPPAGQKLDRLGHAGRTKGILAMTDHPAIAAGRAAVVTGAASGIGLAAARRFAGLGLNLCLADLPGAALDEAARTVGVIAAASGARAVASRPTSRASRRSSGSRTQPIASSARSAC